MVITTDQLEQRIKDYLDAEGFVERTTPDLKKEGWWGEFCKTPQGRIEFFDYVAGAGDNEIPRYDLLGSRMRPYREWVLERVARKVLSRGYEKPRILDVCCGTGLEAVFLGREFLMGNVVGVDLSPHMIQASKLRASKNGAVNVSFEMGNRDRLDPSLKDFDVLTCLSSMHDCVPEFYGVAGEVYRIMYMKEQIEGFKKVIAPKGSLILSFNHIIPKDSEIDEEIWRRDLEIWRNILDMKGFTDIETEETRGPVEKVGMGVFPIISGIKN